MVCADLEGLLLAHQQPDLAILVAFEQPNLAYATLFPLPRIVVEPIQLALAASNCKGIFLAIYNLAWQESNANRCSGKLGMAS